RREKYLLLELSSGGVLLMPLGMSGSFRVAQPRGETTPGVFYRQRGKPSLHDHVVFHMSSGAVVSFNDPRRFGMMKVVRGDGLAQEPLLRSLGPEPLSDAFDAAALARLLRGKKTSLKAALSDQRVVSGLGNIYVCEALHRAGISPRRRASTLSSRSGAGNERTRSLVRAIKSVLRDAIRAGGSSLRDHRRTDGARGVFHHRFRVYARAGLPCPRRGCTGIIKRAVQAGRSTFFCPVCQK